MNLDFGGRFLNLGGFWGHFWGVLEGHWAPFLVSGRLLVVLFLVLEAPWGTLWHQMAPRTDFFGFWMRFGVHFGRLLGSRVGFGRSFGSLLVAFGRSLGVFFWFCLGKCETMKSVVLL